IVSGKPFLIAIRSPDIFRVAFVKGRIEKEKMPHAWQWNRSAHLTCEIHVKAMKVISCGF
ncbi:MAG: hypothetical protein PVH37_20775, partial [Desulfobacterales bacterium]